VLEPAADLATLEADALNHAELAAARSAFDAALGGFNSAKAAYTAAQAATLAQWQAEVPETLWLEAGALWAAEAGLQALSVPPTALVTAVGAAEAALLAALEAAAPLRRRAEDAAAALAEETARVEADAALGPALAAAALRGPLPSGPWLQA